MTSKIWNVVKDRLGDVGVAILGALVTFALEHWDLIGSTFYTFWWYYGLPGITLYLAFQLYRFGSSFYQRFTRLEAQVLGDRSSVETRMEALVKSLHVGREEVIRNIEKGIVKTRQELDSQAHEREKYLQEVLRQEIHAREDLEQQVSTLKQLIASQAEQIAKLREKLVPPPPKREPTLADRFTNPDKTPNKDSGLLQKAAPVPSLLDIFPHGGMLSKAAKPPKGTTNGGSGTPHDL